ncbi:hypothetical protein MAGR_67560 [Mycolicibacterium agri]|uniref:Uncharacterized protein n=1 Tax=Mycolicibacterium agri TaxID=36811 RepID=A0A7I9WC59_MYCAG|nr:hypothetical protein MAGR_67560 [Mycolicibacterium agri]
MVPSPWQSGGPITLASDTDDLESLLNNLLQGASFVIDGITNGGYGPDLAPLVTPTAALIALAEIPH